MPASHVMDVESLARELNAAIAGEVRANEPMSAHTTFGLGGPADLFVTAVSRSDLQAVLEFCRDRKVPVLPVGDGSNLLVSDTGVRGALVKLGGKFDQLSLRGEEFTAGAGAGISQAIAAAASGGLGGLEVLYGVPGSVGGGVYMNAGAYGGEIGDVLIETEHLNADGGFGGLKGPELAMSYRRSPYTDGDRIVTGAYFRLRRGDPAEIEARMAELIQRRFEKQPMDLPSAGSTFKRPEGAFAAELIDRCGLKGFRIGGAEVSEKHAGFVVNRGGATCREVLALIEHVKKTVLEQTGFRLEPEVKFLGI